MEEQKFTVKTEAFNGPLDLLLNLIEKRKLFINDIALAAVADDYVEHSKRLEHFPVAETAHFLLIASTLLLIKSRSLLPTLKLTEEEVTDVEELERRLKLHQQMRKHSRRIGHMFGRQPLFFRASKGQQEVVFSPDASMTLNNVAAAIGRVLEQLPKKELVPKAIVHKVVSLEEMIDRLARRIQINISLGFREFSDFGKAKKTEVVVSFLALLELVKQGVISVAQEQHFSDISMETKHVGIPQYE